MKVAIVGSRMFPDAYLRVRKCILRMKELYGDKTIIITGGGGIVDHCAMGIAIELGLTTIIFPADWEKHGRGAGLLRNTKIVKNCDKVFAFWDGKSRGTADTIRKAQIADKPVIIRGLKK